MLQTLFLYLFMLLIFGGYTIYFLKKYGVPPSFSEGYYILPPNRKILFILFLYGFAIPAIILANTALMFLAGSFILFVSAAPLFKKIKNKNTQHWVHMIGAYSGIVFGEASLCLDFGLWPIAAIFAILAITLFIIRPKNHIWWIELLAFISIYIGIGIHLLKERR